ncbi:hypothetical protein [Spirosoma sp. 48-14]|uniref:hypothetical protein n=2 Tax=unclassified Spirosoma TaxID=2621999 RepID=UPI000962B317|nr:hypothetical protein [Spirosoma sp. 48-14]OJW80561.1 MAG: hypothetical protein BGO59_34360 [Spirosoma sp. 48-14]
MKEKLECLGEMLDENMPSLVNDANNFFSPIDRLRGYPYSRRDRYEEFIRNLDDNEILITPLMFDNQVHTLAFRIIKSEHSGTEVADRFRLDITPLSGNTAIPNAHEHQIGPTLLLGMDKPVNSFQTKAPLLTFRQTLIEMKECVCRLGQYEGGQFVVFLQAHSTETHFPTRIPASYEA